MTSEGYDQLQMVDSEVVFPSSTEHSPADSESDEEANIVIDEHTDDKKSTNDFLSQDSKEYQLKDRDSWRDEINKVNPEEEQSNEQDEYQSPEEESEFLAEKSILKNQNSAEIQNQNMYTSKSNGYQEKLSDHLEYLRPNQSKIGKSHSLNEFNNIERRNDSTAECGKINMKFPLQHCTPHLKRDIDRLKQIPDFFNSQNLRNNHRVKKSKNNSFQMTDKLNTMVMNRNNSQYSTSMESRINSKLHNPLKNSNSFIAASKNAERISPPCRDSSNNWTRHSNNEHHLQPHNDKHHCNYNYRQGHMGGMAQERSTAKPCSSIGCTQCQTAQPSHYPLYDQNRPQTIVEFCPIFIPICCSRSSSEIDEIYNEICNFMKWNLTEKHQVRMAPSQVRNTKGMQRQNDQGSSPNNSNNSWSNSYHTNSRYKGF